MRDNTLGIAHLTRNDLPDATDLPLILTSREAADLLRVNYRTVEKMARDGVLPGVQLGKSWRFSRDLLIRYCAGETKVSSAEDPRSHQPQANSRRLS